MKRKRGTLSSSLEHRLNSYALAASAAGVSFLALAQPAEAKIVYTPEHTLRSPRTTSFVLILITMGLRISNWTTSLPDLPLFWRFTHSRLGTLWLKRRRIAIPPLPWRLCREVR